MFTNTAEIDNWTVGVAWSKSKAHRLNLCYLFSCHAISTGKTLLFLAWHIFNCV